jgi:succinate dehydrogenase / fumarate reductase, membrane anchor subunit
MTIDQGRRTRPAGGLELYAWLFMRVSGLTLIVMVLIHFAIMHVINDIQDINFAFVVKRFATPFWISYDLVMLILALLHGLNGLRIIIDDYVKSRPWRVMWLSALYVVGLVFLVVGTVTLVTFRPDAGRAIGQ